jgi:hypothetical protein
VPTNGVLNKLVLPENRIEVWVIGVGVSGIPSKGYDTVVVQNPGIAKYAALRSAERAQIHKLEVKVNFLWLSRGGPNWHR